MNKLLRISLTINILGLLSVSCKENDIILDFDNDSDKRTFELNSPFAKVNVTGFEWLQKEYEDETFIADEQGLIYLSYTKNVYHNWESLVKINNYSNNLSLSTVKNGQPLVYEQIIKLNNSNDVRYDSLKISKGYLQYKIEAPLKTTGTITISIPGLLFNNTPYSKQLTVTEANRNFDITEILEHAKIILNNQPASSYITFTVTINLTPVNQAETPDNATIAILISQIEPKIAFGYFGQRKKEILNTSISLSFFNKIEYIEGISLADIKLKISGNNVIGVPFNVKTDNIRLFKEVSPGIVDMLLINGTNYIEMGIPACIYGNSLTPGSNSYIINQTNSNIVPILNKFPDKLLFDMDVTSNPNGEEKQNFMNNETELRTDLTIDIPFFFKTELYSRSDTIKFDFNDIIGDNIEDVEKIESLEIYFDFNNKFPFAISANAWVINGKKEKIETLFSGNKIIIKEGIPESNGMVTQAVNTQFINEVTNEQIKNFINYNAMNIILETSSVTYNEGQNFVKIFKQSELNATITIKSKATIP